MAEFQGKVAWFNNAKGYGFLTLPDAEDVFCHYTAIQKDGFKSLQEGEDVIFDIVQGDHGRQAANVVSVKRHLKQLKASQLACSADAAENHPAHL